MNEKLEITEVVNRYFAVLDQRMFDAETLSGIFTDDVVVIRPNGVGLTGTAEIRASQTKSMERFRATQHLTSGFIVDLAGESNASFRVNLIALHFWKEGFGDPSVKKEDNYFLAGGVASGRTIKTDRGWRIVEIQNDVVWRKGVGSQEVMNTK